MNADIPNELFWLTLSAIWTAMLWMPYAYVRIRKIGWVRVFIDPLPGDDPFDQDWAHRAYRAHMNAVETLIPFAAVTFAVVASGQTNAITATAAAVFFWSKVLHTPVYILKIPALRLLTFMAGLGATLVMAAELLF